jgi:hypothetical protein
MALITAIVDQDHEADGEATQYIDRKPALGLYNGAALFNGG